MKLRFRILILATSVFFTTKSFAQNVAINEDGSAANANAILDIKSSNKGILIPRVSTAARLAIPNTKGLLVFDSTANSFFFNTGAGWQNISGSASGGWQLTGNSGTDSSNFLGTLDNKALTIKVNNQYAGRIEPASSNNIVLGVNAGKAISGVGNTGLGALALQSTTTGEGNTAVGDSSLASNISGEYNTAIGHRALALSSGYGEYTAVGAYTLLNATTSYGDVAVGNYALKNHTSGGLNTAVGSAAMANDISGFKNTAVGYYTLHDNNGQGNTALGIYALATNNSGNFNTSLGHQALYFNVSGSSNVAVGDNALFDNVGSFNTAVGPSALSNTTGAQFNTAIGYQAGKSFDMGWNNTIIGANADVSGNGLFNCVALGQGAIANASNKVRIGNSSITKIEGQVPFSTPSDGRFKYQVREDVKGLDFIMQLRPVTYQFDVKKFDGQLHGSANSSGNTSNANDVIQASYNEASAIRRTGFIAQEVEKAANASGYDFSGIIKPKTDDDHYSLSYESFVVPLVKAVQEQQKLILDLQKQIAELKQQVHSK
jgi:trimeric autotransporter adhesin